MDPEILAYYEESRMWLLLREMRRKEAAVVAATRGGMCGVLIVYNRLGMMVTCQPDMNVPYGWVHERTDVML